MEPLGATLISVLKLTPWVAFPLSVVALALLHNPANINTILGFQTVVEQNRALVGVAFILTTCGWVSAVLKRLWERFERGAATRTKLHRLASLDRYERYILGYCGFANQQTFYLSLRNSLGSALCQKGLAVQASGIASPHQWAYTIPDDVWAHRDKLRRLLTPEELKIAPGYSSPVDFMDHVQSALQDG